jgi:hypothetical protein
MLFAKCKFGGESMKIVIGDVLRRRKGWHSAFGRTACVRGKTLKGGRFAVLTRKGAKAPS